MRTRTIRLTQHEYHYLSTLLSEKMVEAAKQTPPSEDVSHLFREKLLKQLGKMLFHGEMVLLPYNEWNKICTAIEEISEDLDSLNGYLDTDHEEE